jgi:site-specific recombinase XerC
MSVSLKESKGYYYGRVRLSGKETTVSLGTDSPIVARGRIEELRAVQRELIAGIPIRFSWNGGIKGGSVAFPTIGEAVQEFIEVKRGEGIRERSLRNYSELLNVFVKYADAGTPINKVNQNLVDGFKIHLMESERVLKSGEIRTLARATVNTYLLNVKIFAEWLGTAYKLDAVQIKKLRLTKEIKYIPQKELDEILEAALKINPLLSRVFELYGRLGLRLNEGFNGDIYINTLRISGDLAKGHRERIIELGAGDGETLRLMRATWSSERVSRLFKKACTGLKLPYHFHQLRATAGIKLYLMSRDIFYCRFKLGHADTKTTEKYLELDLMKLKEDFPEFGTVPVRLAR